MSTYHGPPQSLGQRLALAGATLTTSYTGGDSLGLKGTAATGASLRAVFAAGSTLTSIEFRWEVSDDGTTWEPVAGVRGSDGVVLNELSLAKVDGSTVREVFSTESHTDRPYVRLVAKHTGGAAAAGDKAQADVRFVP